MWILDGIKTMKQFEARQGCTPSGDLNE